MRLRFVTHTVITWPQTTRGGGLQQTFDRVPIYRYKIMAYPFLFEMMVPVAVNYRD